MMAIDPLSLPMPGIRHVPRVTVAFVNNTSDRALRATEAQFLSLLRGAAAGFDLRVEFFTCPNITRAAPPLTCSGAPYADMTDLFDYHVDALIVTGMEPTTCGLRDEPVWHPLTRLIDWVDRKGIPSIWSCLAAHAAVLGLDGVERTPSSTKVSDIQCCEVVAHTHPMMSGLPRQWWTPHSRYYGLSEAALVERGYQVLSRTVSSGVDVFTKTGRAPFVFLQGHPEYEHDSLMKEYKRDVRRYFYGARDDYPIAPASYFTPEMAFILEQYRQQALQNPHRARSDLTMLDRVRGIADSGVAPVRWDNVAVAIYQNWIASFGLDVGQTKVRVQPPGKAKSASRRAAAMPQPLFVK